MDATTPTLAEEDRAQVMDLLLAVGLTLFSWVQVSAPRAVGLRMRELPIPLRGAPQFFRIGPSLLTYALIALAFLPLVFRRRYPGPVALVTAAAAAAYALLPNPPAFTLAAVLIALYSLGAHGDRRELLVWGSLATLVFLTTALPAPTSELFLADVVRSIAVLLAAAFLGVATRNRRAYVAEVERRAAEAERTREEEARRRVDEERLRIARELHDVTAHSLSVIAVQSGAAAHVLEKDPAEARRSIEAIRATSRAALSELRAMLGVLRGADDEQAPLTPAPGLARLGELVGPLEEAGLQVDVTTEGDLSSLPAMVDASAYRIVQEALTNVLRHAGRTPVSVRVVRSPASIGLEVADEGEGAPAAGEGHGIAGMRERASALGGTFEAGPRPQGGWLVRATLPLDGRTVT